MRNAPKFFQIVGNWVADKASKTLSTWRSLLSQKASTFCQTGGFLSHEESPKTLSDVGNWVDDKSLQNPVATWRPFEHRKSLKITSIWSHENSLKIM